MFDGLGDLNDGEAYQIRMKEDDVLEVSGFVEEISIDLEEGWNIVGHTKPNPISIEDAYITILEDIVYVKDGFGNLYYPEMGIDEIQILNPGKGYQIMLASSIAEFSYPYLYEVYECGDCVGCTDDMAFNFDPIATADDDSCEFYDFMPHSSVNMMLVLSEGVFDAIDLPLGGVVVAFTNVEGVEVIVGSTKWYGESCSLSIWNDDSSTSEIDGCPVGALVSLRYEVAGVLYAISNEFPLSSNTLQVVEVLNVVE